MNNSSISDARWDTLTTNDAAVFDLVSALSRIYSLSISPITASLLVNRGFNDPDNVYRFLYPDLSHMPDPFLMVDMDRAVSGVMDAVVSGKRIWVYGDYDVDGITSVSIIVLFFRSLGVDVSYYIPDRVSEGYGLNEDAVRHIAGRGAELIITVDCGISNHREIELAKNLGISVVVTDHHEVPDVLPDALAVLDPKRPDCRFPHDNLAGVGIAYNLLVALRMRMRDEGTFDDLPNLKRYLDLVALGTVADIVPLVGENRLFVKYGLMELNETDRPGIVALKEIAGIKDVGTTEISFRIAPRINASGRVGSADQSVRLMTTEDPAEALAIARDLDRDNRTRQEMEEQVLRQALEAIDHETLDGHCSIVLASEQWHPGVVGIVASRLVDRFYRPIIMMSLSDGIAKGSARSIHGFHLYQGLTKLEELLIGFGGHQYAAGLSMEKGNISEFRDRFDAVVREMTCDEDFIPTVKIDAEIVLSDIHKRNLLHEIKLMMPFGAGNPEPQFLTRCLMVKEARIVGRNHLRMVFKDDKMNWDAIAFGQGRLLNNPIDTVDAVFAIRENRWNRSGSCELHIKDIRVE
ncbi:MAG: single-stranded-DNA-specific exonuclease RecJ [Deltaproteobacteria bacterium]|nr:single-stranded-DNA-specific exonuclease RecJ [Candidatus Zymogenaceae bacterium]